MPDATAVVLNWHRDRRALRVPTVSTLVGPPGLGSRAWREWAARPVVATTACRLGEVVNAWSAAALAADLPAAAARWLRRETAATFELAAATRHDLDELRRGCHGESSDPTVAVAFRLLHAAAAGRELRADELAAAVADPAQSVAGVCGLEPDAAWPTLLLTPAEDDFAQAARSLERLAVAAPRLPVGVCVAAGVFARFAADSSRALALAREGAVAVPEVTATQVSDRLRAAGADPEPLEDAVRWATGRGLAPAGADALVEAVTAPRPVAPDAPGFRSAAERYLFELLESTPATAGLFRPNQALPFKHGTKPGEADLLAAEFKLAVEFDGAYFHLNEGSYRRDRRKDYSYHRHGYLALRFLAEDVVEMSQPILETILDALAHRRAAKSPPEVPPVA